MDMQKVNKQPIFMAFCCKCNRRLYNNREPMWADLDGVPFGDY